MILQGIRVIDWTVMQVGSAAASILGDMGAEVIKVEPRLTGDAGRGMRFVMGHPVRFGQGGHALWEAWNRNKQGIALDLKKEKGREVLLRLVEKSDVFIYNYRPQAAAALGLDYESLKRVNPKLVYASATAFGGRGPEGGRGGYDLLGQARSGVMMSSGEPEWFPVMVNAGFADQVGATFLAFGVVSALLARERLGIGQQVDTSILGGLISLQNSSVSMALLTGHPYQKQSRRQAPNPMYNWYQCSDGKWIALSMLQGDRYWPPFCRAMGLEELEKDARFDTARKRADNSAELVAILDRVFATRTAAQWDSLFRQGDLLWSLVQEQTDLAQDPQVRENQYVVEFSHPTHGPVEMVGFPMSFSQTPCSLRLPAPELGQHTEEVLLEVAGYTWEEIEELRQQEVI